MEMKMTETIGGSDCTIYTTCGAVILLHQPVDDLNQSLPDSELRLLRNLTERTFNYVAFAIKDWMSELAPWFALPNRA